MDQPCPVCSAGPLERYGEYRWEIEGVERVLARCATCGSAMTDPLPPDAVIDKLYKENFAYTWYADHAGAKLADCRERIRELSAVPGFREGRILDYGGGLGHFRRAAREAGFDCDSHDPYARAGAAPRGPFEVVTGFHVLEHALNPAGLLARMASLAAPGGRIVLAVPNFASRGWQEMGVEWTWAQPPLLHLFHFTEAGLVALVEAAGLTVESVSFHERWDANYRADVTEAETTRRMEADWSRRPWSRFALYRRHVARRNARRRFALLKISRRQAAPDARDLSELHLVAKKA